jgi:hypothetical protein
MAIMLILVIDNNSFTIWHSIIFIFIFTIYNFYLLLHLVCYVFCWLLLLEAKSMILRFNLTFTTLFIFFQHSIWYPQHCSQILKMILRHSCFKLFILNDLQQIYHNIWIKLTNLRLKLQCIHIINPYTWKINRVSQITLI